MWISRLDSGFQPLFLRRRPVFPQIDLEKVSFSGFLPEKDISLAERQENIIFFARIPKKGYFRSYFPLANRNAAQPTTVSSLARATMKPCALCPAPCAVSYPICAIEPTRLSHHAPNLLRFSLARAAMQIYRRFTSPKLHWKHAISGKNCQTDGLTNRQRVC